MATDKTLRRNYFQYCHFDPEDFERLQKAGGVVLDPGARHRLDLAVGEYLRIDATRHEHRGKGKDPRERHRDVLQSLERAGKAWAKALGAVSQYDGLLILILAGTEAAHNFIEKGQPQQLATAQRDAKMLTALTLDLASRASEMLSEFDRVDASRATRTVNAKTSRPARKGGNPLRLSLITLATKSVVIFKHSGGKPSVSKGGRSRQERFLKCLQALLPLEHRPASPAALAAEGAKFAKTI